MGKITHKIWDNCDENKARGIYGKTHATMDFGMKHPRCNRCKNKEGLPTIKVFDNKQYPFSKDKMKLCLRCIQDLLVGVQQAIEEHKLHHLVHTGQADVRLIDILTGEAEAEDEQA